MEVIATPELMRDWSRACRQSGRSIGLVPTMGYFHDGHLSLMRQAAALTDQVVVSLFVNPLQFGPGEDLARYPRNFERDRDLAARSGVAVLFAPTAAAMYPEPPETRIAVGRLGVGLCGRSRPGHFDGVCTVVGKLFNIVSPELAVFGRKDFQQLAVIRQMTVDLNWGVKIVAHPIVRESDGLAMSSRNRYLSGLERQSATCLYRAIVRARQLAAAGEGEVAHLLSAVEQIIAAHDNVCLEYTEIVSATTLVPQLLVGPNSLLALAVRIGATRLIDNAMLLEPCGNDD